MQDLLYIVDAETDALEARLGFVMIQRSAVFTAAFNSDSLPIPQVLGDVCGLSISQDFQQ